jgi:predicted nucleic acid-binding protein
MELPWLENRHVLLDTNVLINYSKAKGGLTPFFELLGEHKCPVAINDAVYFEFIRVAKTKTELGQLQQIVKQFLVLPTSKANIESATEISMLCSAKENNHATRTSFVDNLLGAQLKKYGDKIILATSDFEDFPLHMYERMHVKAYDLGKNVITIGFIGFDQAKWEACLDTFTRKQ